MLYRQTGYIYKIIQNIPCFCMSFKKINNLVLHYLKTVIYNKNLQINEQIDLTINWGVLKHATDKRVPDTQVIFTRNTSNR